jgi:ribonuclease HI
MELIGVIEGLRALTRSCKVRVHLDSSYVMHGFTKGWLAIKLNERVDALAVAQRDLHARR